MTAMRPSANRPDTETDTGSNAVPEADGDAAEDAAGCRRHALGALARREHSRLELERKLHARGHASETVAATLDGLERTGLLSTERFCESFVRARVGKGQGPARIERELTERGVESARAADVLSEAQDWVALAREVRRRKFGDELPQSYKERARQSRFLQYRGFSTEQIRAALREADFE